MNKSSLETIIGLVVVCVAIFFAYTMYKASTITGNSDNTYTLKAYFDRADGINQGSDVKISGVKIGKVLELSLDYDNYSAIVTFSVINKVKLSSDSSAEIVSNGLIGDKYISISPGSEQELLKEGDVIEFTQSSVNLEGLISKFIFGTLENNDDNAKDEDLTNTDNDSTKEEKYDEKHSPEILYQGDENSVG